jgi:hypothetical protein
MHPIGGERDECTDPQNLVSKKTMAKLRIHRPVGKGITMMEVTTDNWGRSPCTLPIV